MRRASKRWRSVPLRHNIGAASAPRKGLPMRNLAMRNLSPPTTSRMGNWSGRIRPDSQAVLTMVGRTGPEEMTLDHERPGSPIQYTANVHFDAHGGSGIRNERGACRLIFTKA
jgi:hypothetical protein